MNKLRNDESGIGLIEIVVSMFLLALVAMAFLPFLINSFTVTRSNTTLATATQLLDRQFDELRALQPANCATLTTFKAARTTSSPLLVNDADRNTKLRAVVTVFACPTNTTSSGTTDLTIAILDSAGTTVVSATTKVYVAP